MDALRLSTLQAREQVMSKVDALRLSTLRFDIWGNKGEDV